MTGSGRHDLVGMSGRVGALAPARHARRVHLPKSFSPPGRGGLFSAVRSKKDLAYMYAPMEAAARAV